MITNLGHILAVNLVFFSVMFFSAVILLVLQKNLLKSLDTSNKEFIVSIFSFLAITVLSYLITQAFLMLLLPLVLGITIFLILNRSLKNYSTIGRYFLISNFLVLIAT